MGLVILAKVPEEGRVKTRLRLPPGPTLALHRAMAADVRDACVAAGARPAWAIAGDLGHPWVKGLEALGDRVLPQAGGDLGARIEAALMAADRPGNAVALGMQNQCWASDAFEPVCDVHVTARGEQSRGGGPDPPRGAGAPGPGRSI